MKILEKMDLTAVGIWFPISVGIALFLFMLFMPKRLSWREIYLTFGTVGYVTWVIDLPFMAAYFDLFDVGAPKVPGIGDVITYGVIPSLLAVIFLNYFKHEKKWRYVAGFTLLSFLFEWALVQVGYMNLKGWVTWWSIPVYFFVYGFWLPWHLGLMRKLNGVEDKKYRFANKFDLNRIIRIKEKVK